jgi:hypothetical protein
MSRASTFTPLQMRQGTKSLAEHPTSRLIFCNSLCSVLALNSTLPFQRRHFTYTAWSLLYFTSPQLPHRQPLITRLT